MALNANLVVDVQEVCDNILNVNVQWYDKEPWIFHEGYYNSWWAKDYNCLDSMPDTVYFSYTDNAGRMYKHTSALNDIHEALSSMINLYPVLYGIALEKGLVFVPNDPWCYVLEDISGNELLVAQRNVVNNDTTTKYSNTEELQQANDIIPRINHYWEISRCSDTVKSELATVWIDLQSRGISLPETHRCDWKPASNWAWSLQDILFTLMQTKPIKYSYSCNNSMENVACLDKVYDAFGHWPAEMLGCEEISDGVQFITDPTKAGWSNVWCEPPGLQGPQGIQGTQGTQCTPPGCCSMELKECLENLNEKYDLDLTIESPDGQNWAWELRDSFLNMLDSSEIRRDINLIFGITDDLIPSKDEVMDFFSDYFDTTFDYGEIVCCEELTELRTVLCTLACMSYVYEPCGWQGPQWAYKYTKCTGW